MMKRVLNIFQNAAQNFYNTGKCSILESPERQVLQCS